MAFRANLKFEGKEYDVLQCKYSFHRDVDLKGRPGFTIYSNEVKLANNEVDVPVSSNIKLDYTQNTFNISFNTLDYSLNQIVDYSYMLNGLENIWYDTQGENSVTFRNIPPGWIYGSIIRFSSKGIPL